MKFQDRLSKAIERGEHISDRRSKAEAQKRLNEQELKRLHSEYRLQLSEQIESCLRALLNHFPGFQYETIVGEKGWGGAISRDDIGFEERRKRRNYYSRLELVIRPVSKYFVLDLAGKGTIRNKEIFSRSHFQRIDEVDLHSFEEMIDNWTLEYAERFAASN
ncbi:MAG: hypothetical protein PVH19_06950 [Planctomycetia bacterium]|jgi:hypothetical protein